MNKGLFSKILPHLIAVVIFLIVAVIYCSPALQGEVVTQHDITQWKGSFQQAEVFKETYGHYPLWINSLFSGMPAFQIGGVGGNYAGYISHTILSLGLPKPISFFFLASLCFYILAQVLRVRSYISILGALAFAYATYDPVIIGAGHDTKMFSIAYMPAVIGSFILIYDRKYWLGALLAAVFTSAMVAQNHLQIVYYTFLIIGVMTVFYVVREIRNKEGKSLALALPLAGAVFLIGVLSNAVVLFSTYEYQKETIRGAPSPITDSTAKKEDADNGLTKDYAFSYSMRISEPLVMLVPHMYGGSGKPIEDLVEGSSTMEALQTMPQQLANDIGKARGAYWGGLVDTGGGTSGPPYLGAIVCFLAILGIFVLNGRHKWWAFAATILSIVMSWGSYFEGFNTLLYNYLPFYNKFRAPSMALVIPQVLLPMLAVLALDRIAATEDKKQLTPLFKRAIITTGALFVLLFILYMSLDFLSNNDRNMLNQAREMNQPQITDAVSTFFNALKKDRQSLMLGQIFRSIGFIAVSLLIVLLMIRNSLKPLIAIPILTVLTFTDLMAVNVQYLSSEDYQEVEENNQAFQKTQADETILADKSVYRVFNVSGNAFQENYTSYYYNSVGGYHAAKLRVYQDLIDHQLSKQPLNEAVLDMLNTKYLIQKDGNGLTQAYQARPTSIGAAWFVNAIRFVKDATEEMAALNHFNPRDTAIVQEKFRTGITSPVQPDSAGTIQLVKNENDVISYRTQSAASSFAVFSEIYYDKGWKAYIDNKEVPIVKTNYVLRGLSIPAGAHDIRFEFKPEGYYMGKTVGISSMILLLLLFAAVAFMEWKKRSSSNHIS